MVAVGLSCKGAGSLSCKGAVGLSCKGAGGLSGKGAVGLSFMGSPCSGVVCLWCKGSAKLVVRYSALPQFYGPHISLPPQTHILLLIYHGCSFIS